MGIPGVRTPLLLLASAALTLPIAVRDATPQGRPVSGSLSARAANGEAALPALLTFRPAGGPQDGGRAHGPQAIAGAADALIRDHRAAGLTVRRRYSHLPILAVTVTERALESLAVDPRVVALSPSRTLRAFRTQGKKLMNVPDVQELGWNGAGVGIAILDTGVDYEHEELSPGGTDAGVKTVKLYDAIDLDGDPRDREGHGTSVAGIAAGTDGGVAELATIVAVRVLDEDGEGTSEQILDGLNAVLASVDAGNPFNIRVANLSLGGYDDSDWPPFEGSCDDIAEDFKTAFDALTDAGVLVVVAAGNGGCSGGVAFPACVSSALAVGAVYDDEICTLPAPPPLDCLSHSMSFNPEQCRSSCSDATKADRIACYSDSGEELDVWAPSHCARTPRKGGGLEDCFGGTSAAAPYVAGVAALLSQAVPGATPIGIRQALRSTGRAISDGRNGVTRERVDAAAALASLESCAAPAAPHSLTVDVSAPCQGDTVSVSWPTVEGAATYVLETAGDPSFATGVTAHSAASPPIELSFSGQTPRTIYLRLRAAAACGASSGYTPTIQLAYAGGCVSGAVDTVYVLGIGHAAGVPPAFFYSDLAVLNPGSETVELAMTFQGTSTLEATAGVGPHAQATWEDVLVSLFGLSGSDVGLIRIDASGPIEALVRTYSRPTDAPDRSFGQLIAGMRASDALTDGQVGYLPGLRSDNPWGGAKPFRTNVLFANVSAADADVEVTFFTGAGAPIATINLAGIPPGGQKQATYALPAGYSAAFAEVRVSPTGARVIGLASVIDGTSTDPTTIPVVVP